MSHLIAFGASAVVPTLLGGLLVKYGPKTVYDSPPFYVDRFAGYVEGGKYTTERVLVDPPPRLVAAWDAGDVAVAGMVLALGGYLITKNPLMLSAAGGFAAGIALPLAAMALPG